MKRRLLGTYIVVIAICLFIPVLLRVGFGIQDFWIKSLLTFIIASGVGAYFANKFFIYIKKQLIQIAGWCRRIAGGDSRQHEDMELDDEFGQLANALVEMKVGLDNNFTDLNNTNMQLKAVLNSISNGIVTVDNTLNIVLLNHAAQELFDIQDDAAGKYFLEIFIDSRLDRMLQNAIDKGMTSSIELNRKLEDPKILKVLVAPVKNNVEIIGAVMLVQDITELHRLEQMRSDFAANVSHELKTPLTSIKGFIQTLLDGAIEDVSTAKKFLNIIDIEADRLSRLINDILSLSEIEFRKGGALFRKINMTTIVHETVEMMKSHAREKEISMSFIFAKEEIWIHGNTDRIKQMIINLIDNAIKYTPRGGSVTVLLEDLHDKVIMRIKDTGIGIAKEHTTRIFERFYRVDKGRSRNMGGTGLGLAIVKHIVRGMNGSIAVQSQPGKGTEFEICIPKR